MLAVTVALSSLNSTGALAAEKVKYGAAIKDGKLYSLEIREDSVIAVPASKSNPVNDKYGDKYFIQDTYTSKGFTVFDRFGNATTYDYKSNGVSTSNGIESCNLEDEAGNKYMFYQGGGVFPFEYDDSQVGSKNTIIVEKNGKKGLIDNSGKKITDCKYDVLYYLHTGRGSYFEVTKDGKKGILNDKGIEIIPCEYDEIYKYNALFYVEKGDKSEYISIKKNKKIIYDAVQKLNGFTIVRKNGKLGVINNSGREILKCEYDEIGEKYDDGYLGIFGFYKLNNVKKNGKWGYVDNKGRVKVKFKYDNAETFYGKFARVGSKGDWRFINKKGKEVYKFNYEDMGSFTAGSVFAKKDGKWGSVDKDNKKIVDFIYEDVREFMAGRVSAKKDGKWGFIDRKGNILTSFIYEEFDYCSPKLISVRQGTKWGIVDKNGNVVQECKFDKRLVLTYDKNGDKWINTEINGKHGLLDENGREIYPAESEEHIWVDGDVARVKKNGKYGLINREGKEIYPCTAENISEINGIFCIRENENKDIAINNEGRIISPSNATYIQPEGPMLKVRVQNSEGHGILDSNGNEILPMKYNDISYQNGVFTVYDGKYGIFNIKGKQILPLEYDKIYIFGSDN